MIDFTDKFKGMNIDNSSTLQVNSENLQQIPIDFLRKFGYDNHDMEKLHCFRPYSPKRLQKLADDIKKNGILSPITVRQRENNLYEILAGHNRCQAAKLSGLKTLPCLVKKVDDDQAVIIMTTTNLNQREELLPSEKAFAYKAQMEAYKHQKCQIDTAQNIADDSKESRRQVFRYMRLTCLIPELLQRVDSKTLPFSCGVSLSYLPENIQRIVAVYCEKNNIKIDVPLCDFLKAELKGVEQIDEEDLEKILPKKEKQISNCVSIKIPQKIYLEFFGDISKAEAEKRIIFLISSQLGGSINDT